MKRFGMDKEELGFAQAGDIVSVAGGTKVTVGHTLTTSDTPFVI